MKIFLAGGTGFIGSRFRDVCLAAGHSVFVLSRKNHDHQGVSRQERPGEIFVSWDGKNPGDWRPFLEKADAVVNLVGEGVAAKRWTARRKSEIVSSRIETTRILVEAVGDCRNKPQIFLNASATGYYGHVPFGQVTEQDGPGNGFLADTCQCWENQALRAEKRGIRTVLARLGPVLGEGGGVLKKMVPPFSIFMGGPLGSGNQWVPWVHRDDVVRALLFILTEPSLSGAVNVTAPEPVTMNEFAVALGRILKRPSGLPVPSFVLKLLMGEMSALVLEGACVKPAQLLRAGFLFHFPDINSALSAILIKTNKGSVGNSDVPHV